MHPRSPAPEALDPPAGKDADQEDLHYHVYGSMAEASPLKDEWNGLAVRTGDILSTFDWCEVWWQYFGQRRRLEIHVLHAGGRLVAVLPLFREMIRPGGVWLRTVRLVGCDYTIDMAGLAIEAAHATAFMRLVLDRLWQDEPWDFLQIAPLCGYNTVLEPMAAACADHPKVQTAIIGRQDNWCTLFDLPGTYEAFLGSLPGKTRSEIQRRERQFMERHKVEVEVVRRPEQVQPAIDLLVALHQKRWTGKGQSGRFGGAAR